MSNATADRLNQISEELKGLLEARLQELATAMRGAEQVTRQIVTAEMEIARYNQLAADSAKDLGTLQRDVEAARAASEDAGRRRASLVAEHAAAQEAQSSAERDSRELSVQVAALRARSANLVAEGETLRRDADEMTVKVRTAEENVARLRRLREELMHQMSALSSSAKE